MADGSETVVRRPSRWSQARAGWYRDAARTRIREDVQWPRLLSPVATLLLFGLAADQLPAPLGWLWLGLGLAGAALSVGLWTLSLWAYRIAGVFHAGLVVLMVAAMVTRFDDLHVGQLAYGALLVLAHGSVAADLLGPKKRELFRQARYGPPEAQPPA